MLGLAPDVRRPLRVAALGAHCDDVEIGSGGLLLDLAGAGAVERVDLLVATSDPAREEETRAAIADFVPGVPVVHSFVGLPDGGLPGHWSQLKEALQAFASRARTADLVLAPSPEDAHQDHRLIGEMTRTVFRDHVVLHYEIPKWDGDLGATRPQVYWPLLPGTVERKWQLLQRHYASQRGHDWFREDTFSGLARLRGMECRADHAEAFRSPSLRLALPDLDVRVEQVGEPYDRSGPDEGQFGQPGSSLA